MSSALWAIEAAQKSRQNDPVPGSSLHITREMKANLVAAKDGLSSFDFLLRTCALGLNDIIDSLNGGVEASAIIENVQRLASPAPLPKFEDSLSGSSLLRSADVSAYPKVNLKLEQSERISSGILREPVENVAESLPLGPSSTHDPIESLFRLPHDFTPRAQAEESKVESPYKEESAAEPPAMTPVANAEVSLNRAMDTSSRIPVEKPEPLSSTALSPVHIPRTLNLVTSPDVDLSFIPIAKSINPAKGKLINTNESDDESDTSFQAISTAIRKSFAGKLSMGNFSSTVPLYERKEAELRKTHGVSRAEGQLKPDNTKVSRQTIAGQLLRPKSVYNSSKRSSVFVSLPSREPIAYLKRLSNKVKTEEIELQSRKTVAEAGSHDKSLHTAAKAAPKISRKVGLHETSLSTHRKLETKSNNVPAANTSSLLSSELFSLKGSTALKFNYAPEMTQRKSRSPERAKSPKRARSPKRAKSPELKSISQSKPNMVAKKVTRTTASGSPSREKVAGSFRSALHAPSSRGRSPVRSAIKKESHSSKDSSRSPTKYSHVDDGGSTEASPTNYSNLNVKDEHGSDRGSEVLQRLTLPTSASAAKLSKTPNARDTILKNKFLSTTLNPDKPPLFNPVKGKPRNRSPIKKAGEPSVEQKGAEIKRFLVNDHTRPKRKITIALNHKSDLRAANPVSHNTIPQKRSISPSRSRKADKSSNHSEVHKRGPEPLDTNVVPRKRGGGNAVPLPDAARGKFSKEKAKEKTTWDVTTPSRPSKSSRASKSMFNIPSSASPGMGPHELPDIPSDDEALKKTKYIKSWAETPELLRVMREKSNLDPLSVFGEVPVLKMDEVFESVASRQRGQATP